MDGCPSLPPCVTVCNRRDSDPTESPVSQIPVTDVTKLTAGHKGDRLLLYLANKAGQEWVFKVEEASVADSWSAKIIAAKEYIAKHKGKRPPPRAARDSDDESTGRRSARDSGADSDADEDGGLKLPAAPKWFQQYDKLTRDKDRDAQWMEISLSWFQSLFADIYLVSVRTWSE